MQNKNSQLRDLPLLQDDAVPRFVIYTRKSTDESSEKQVASIPQQIEACYEYAQKEDIAFMPRPDDEKPDPKTLLEIDNDNTHDKKRATELKAFYIQYWVLTERNSAKIPFKRAVWQRMIELIKGNKIRGIMGYSPDRFTRNLQEGGEVIQLADSRQVALKFTNFHYENNAAGQMMLGFWFVFAEHYSKKLSEDVTRGSKKKHQAGKAIGSRKWGYAIDGEDRFIPDPVYLPILKKAFQRKLVNQWSDSMIADEMNKSGWDQVLKDSYGINKKMTPQKISNKGDNGFNLWSDPFYYGEHVKLFKGKEVKADLRELDDPNYTFVPAIEENNWLELQEVLSAQTYASIRKKQSLKSNRLDPVKPAPNNFIKCGTCKQVMIFSLPNRKRFESKMEKENKELQEVVEAHQIRYQCTNKECSHKGFTALWSAIDKKVADLLSSIKVLKYDYQAYLYAKKEDLEVKHIERQQDQYRVNILLNKAEGDYNKFLKKSGYGESLTGKKRDKWEQEDASHEAIIKELEDRKKELRADIREEIFDRQKFVEMIKGLGKFWLKATYVQKRDLLDNFFLNIAIKSEKQLEINIKPELESMFIQDGGPGWD